MNLIAQLNIYQMLHVQTPHEIYVPVFLTNLSGKLELKQKKVKNVFIKESENGHLLKPTK
jgi:hypothetical protein